jgi:chitinase
MPESRGRRNGVDMPPRSIVDTLPEATREELNAKLIASGFSGYRELADWLTSQGFEIKKSALQSYGSKFEDRLQAMHIATGQAKAIVDHSPDDEGAMSEALMRLVQEKCFNILMDMEVDASRVNISSMAKAIAELGRASVTTKKYAAEVKSRAREAADAAAKIANKGGLSKEATAEIRSAILGIAK